MTPPIPQFHSAQVLVVGDVMLDRYWQGHTSRISPEAPVPVVHVKQQTERPGGAGNVALNIAALGGHVTLISLTGDDLAADSILHQLASQGVRCVFNRLPQVPTITKLRILSRHQQLIRLDFEESFNHDPRLIEAHVQAHLNTANVIVLSDYGKGTLTAPQTIIQLARAAHKAVLVDPKGKDFSKYKGATLITPNLAEFEAIVGHCPQETLLVERGENLRDSLALDALLITRSEQGMTLLPKGQAAIHFPAHAREVFDVTGAGDTVIGLLAATLATGQNLVEAVTLANFAAGLVVAKLGAATVSVAELEEVLHRHDDKIKQDLSSLQLVTQAAKGRGETIVMTNGCFDILHAGHVQYLTQARQLGDRLIVAINDDESVRRLKGKNRPVNPLTHRMTVLKALECVDWIIPFSEETPKELICRVLPNILVKGNDYQIHEIAGHDCVLANGGQVLTLTLLDGCSTTNILTQLQK